MPNCTATCAPSREELPLQVTCTLRLRRAASLLPVVSGADGETRTPTGFPTTPSRWRVYQFHHVGAFLRGLTKTPSTINIGVYVSGLQFLPSISVFRSLSNRHQKLSNRHQKIVELLFRAQVYSSPVQPALPDAWT